MKSIGWHVERIHNHTTVALVGFLACHLFSAPAYARDATVHIEVDKRRIGMGRSVEVHTRVALPNGNPGARYTLLSYVNGKRWGAHEETNEDGRATMHLPLPNPGIMRIQVEALPPLPPAVEELIWAPKVGNQQTVYLQGTFTRPAAVQDATLWVAADDAAKVFLNGNKIVGNNPITSVAQFLQAGGNVMSVEAFNRRGPANVVTRLEMETRGGLEVFSSGKGWQAFEEEPPGWPGKASVKGQHVRLMWTVDRSHLAHTLDPWPTLRALARLRAGYRMPEGANVSSAVEVRVDWRQLQAIPEDPDHMVGMQYEPWFTHLFSWQTAQAVPLVGYYALHDRDVLRQHMIWLIESGVNFLLLDWTNHLWGKAHWDERSSGANAIIHVTTLALETLAALRDEGQYVPKAVLYLGLQNGPETTVTAVNEEIEWIYHNYVRSPRFDGLFLEYLGKPLLLIHNGQGPGWLTKTNQAPVNDKHFTIRWQSFQHQANKHHELGYWSWMDGSLEPMVTLHEDKPESMTIPTAFFEPGGWTARKSYGRRGGWTYVESFKAALRHQPRFIQLHQFQEYAGAVEGFGYGEDKNVYVDSYSVEFSDDIEPVSLTAPGYRGDGGWGFFYLNLTRALVDLYRQDVSETTVLVLSSPGRGQIAENDHLNVAWTYAGKPADSFTIKINGKTVGRNLQGTSATVDLSSFQDGPMKLRLTAEGTRSRYPLSYTEDALPLERMAQACVEVEFVLQREKNPRR